MTNCFFFFTAFPHFGGETPGHGSPSLTYQSITTVEKGRFADLWNLELGNIFLALRFAFLLTTLFYMERNISVQPAILAKANGSVLFKAVNFL